MNLFYKAYKNNSPYLVSSFQLQLCFALYNPKGLGGSHLRIPQIFKLSHKGFDVYPKAGLTIEDIILQLRLT